MRSAEIYYGAVPAGILAESNEGLYTFQYHKQYIANHKEQFITFSMPVSEKIYTDTRLFPFFEALIPEGWLLDIASKNWKINQNDRMGLLLACCQNCIGAVSVHHIHQEDE